MDEPKTQGTETDSVPRVSDGAATGLQAADSGRHRILLKTCGAPMSSAKREIVLDRYWLLDSPLAGGMASVYKARDLEKDELVAVKRFDRDKLLPELEAEAFRREVEALRNLIHPNILKIRDAGEDANGRPFLVLEWMSHDLVEHRRRGSTAFNGWDEFADQVAIPLVEALAHAHANGYCHRDVKPANVLVADDGTVKLADFGISKLKRCLQPRITLNEFVSRPYAPPEPDNGAYSYARDVYGFAVLCLWSLSDQPVRDYEHLGPALEQLDVIQDVRKIFARCLSADPNERPQTAGVLSHELARVQSRRRQVASSGSSSPATTQGTRSRRSWAGRSMAWSRPTRSGPLKIASAAACA